MTALSAVAVAQNGQAPQAPPVLDAAERTRAVEEIAVLMEENYAFVELGQESASVLLGNLADGNYDRFQDPMAFAHQLTLDINEICNDRHIGVRVAPPIDPEETPTPEQQELQNQQYQQQAKRDNFGFHELKILSGNVGYLRLNSFYDTESTDAGETAIAAMNFLGNSDALIIDLRTNGGGSPSMIRLISSYLFEEATHLNSFFYRGQDQIDQSWTMSHVPGNIMGDVPVWVLTSPATGSAAEEFTYNLKHLDRATIVGEVTWGGANPGGRHRVGSHFSIFVPQGRAINPITNTNWEGVGVQPDIGVASQTAYDIAYREALQSVRESASSDSSQLYSLDWALEGLNQTIEPYEMPASELEKFVGDYGPRHIAITDGVLYYNRDDRPQSALIPMSESTFAVEGLDFFRIRFLIDDDGVAHTLVGMYDRGHTDANTRNR